MMHDEILLGQFEELADKLEILVRNENINIVICEKGFR